MPADEAELAEWLTGHLPTKRWFAAKARPIIGTTIIRSFRVAHAVDLRIVRVSFTDGVEDYVVPTSVDPPWFDLVESPAFLDWLAGALSATVALDASVSSHQLVRPAVNLTGLPPRPLHVEQSNTSVRYGDEWVVKLNRRLAYGPSPEVELATLLNRWQGDRCAPRTAAALEIVTDHGPATLAIAAEFVPNVGDGWKVLLDALRAEAATGHLSDGGSRGLSEIASVARLTGDLHSALAVETWNTGLSPERIAAADAARWQASAESSLASVVALLSSATATLDDRCRMVAEVVPASVPVVRTQLAGFQALVGSRKTRTHGDYHLGQVLRTPQGPYVAIDFDGEPQRTLAERRGKYSPLRDVAGILRSLSYAVGTIQAELGGEIDHASSPAWERSARALLLETYLARLTENGTDVLPLEPERVRQALSALELEKAIYEVVYELNNRPSWVWIPIGRLVSTR